MKLNKNEIHILSALLALSNMGVPLEVKEKGLFQKNTSNRQLICLKGKLTYNVIRSYWCELAYDGSNDINLSKEFDDEAKYFKMHLKEGCPDCWEDTLDILIKMEKAVNMETKIIKGE